MATLFEITNEFQQFYDMMTDEDVTDQAFLDTLESLTGELAEKASGYANVIKQVEMEAKQAKALELEFKHKKEVRENRIKVMKDRIKDAMITANVDELDAGKFKIKLKSNGGVEPLKITGDVPDNFKKIVVENDNELIRKALEDGKSLEFAHLEPRGKHIEIK